MLLRTGGLLSSGAACIIVLFLSAAGSLAETATKKIVLNGTFGRVVSNAISRPVSEEGVELGQEVRVDPIASSDPDWDGATMTVYEQNLSYPANGTFRSFGVVSTRSGETALLEINGKWDVVRRDGKFVEAPFEGDGRLVGGTGKLHGLGGPVVVKGKLTAENSGAYSVEITAAQ